mmetsp:Transcript_17690/g.39726  ORF Transcript_17690/g.39726 Transcript_17690/m.39726 type:complete len:128 (+) Transcript_17690:432-815(+)
MRRHFRMLGYHHYHALLRSARVVLDTHPYGGCITSHDAMAHSVPLVTLPSHYVRGRFSLALYRQMQMMHMVAKSGPEYVAIALRLLTDDAYWAEQAVALQFRFAQLVQQNNREVAREWAEFFHTALM